MAEKLENEEQKAREEILSAVRSYAKKFHAPKETFTPGDRIGYAGRVYDEEEMTNLVSASLDFWLTGGPYTETLEKNLGEYLGVPFVSFVNSGSSANLLAFMALTSPLLNERQLHPGDEVITVACGFPTTIAPILQSGCVPVFLDLSLPTYNIKTDDLEAAVTEKTKAIIIAHTLGNPFDLPTVKAFADRHQLWLIEDNCDALGSRVRIDNEEKMTGTIGDIGTSSFYPPHHMTTGEGGAVYTKNPLLHRIIRSLRDWGRDCMCPPGKDNFCGHRYDKTYGELPAGYDHKYVYSHFGYNLKATDLQAAIGVAQLKKLPGFVEKRRENFRRFYDMVKDLEDVFILPEETKNARASWFGFLLTCRDSVDRNAIVSALESHNIQTRMLFAGNILKHPCFDAIRATNRYRVVGDLKNSDRIMEKTFWVGLYPGMTDEKLAYMSAVLHEAVKGEKR